MTDLYQQALNDLENLLDNSIENGGGIHYGDLFISRVHWDHEIRDQIHELREMHKDAGEKIND